MLIVLVKKFQRKSALVQNKMEKKKIIIISAVVILIIISFILITTKKATDVTAPTFDEENTYDETLKKPSKPISNYEPKVIHRKINPSEPGKILETSYDHCIFDEETYTGECFAIVNNDSDTCYQLEDENISTICIARVSKDIIDCDDITGAAYNECILEAALVDSDCSKTNKKDLCIALLSDDVSSCNGLTGNDKSYCVGIIENNVNSCNTISDIRMKTICTWKASDDISVCNKYSEDFCKNNAVSIYGEDEEISLVE